MWFLCIVLGYVGFFNIYYDYVYSYNNEKLKKMIFWMFFWLYEWRNWYKCFWNLVKGVRFIGDCDLFSLT